MTSRTLARVAAEWLATADAIRQSRAQLIHLIHDRHPAIVGQRDTAIALLDGLNVASSLEALAQRLASKDN